MMAMATAAAPSGLMTGARRFRAPAALLRLAWLAALLAALAGCTSGKPGTINRHYLVHAETRSGFAVSVRSHAPRGGRAFGLVEITFHPDYKLVAGDGSCTTTVNDVGLELVITLPKWRDGKPLPGSIRGHWGRFERTIRLHEMTHVRIARTYAAKMRRAIAGMKSDKGCNDLRSRIRKRIEQLKAEHLRAHRHFDKREQRRLKRLL